MAPDRSSPPATVDPLEELAAAVHANDAARAAEVLGRHPELRPRLDDALPGGHFGATAMIRAVQWRNREMVDVLLGAGADINAKSRWWAGGFGVLDGGEDDLVDFLIERGAVVDAYAAAHLGRRERLEELIGRDARLARMRGGDGQTPLHVAKTVEIAGYLLDHGADIDALDVDHESTPAQYAVQRRPEVARFLIARGCRTDIIMAAALGDRALVEWHLANDPEAIHTTVSERSFPKRDRRAGGSIYIYTLGAHKTPHTLAREYGHEDIFRLLMERSPEKLKLAQACELGDEVTFRAMLVAQPDLVRSLSEDDRRKLPSAAQSNNTTAVRLMLEAGWPVDAPGERGETALHWAAFHGNAAMVRELVARGAPIDARDRQFDGPPIGWATYGSRHGWHSSTGDYVGAVEALLAAGAVAPKTTGEMDASEPVREALRRHAAGRPPDASR